MLRGHLQQFRITSTSLGLAQVLFHWFKKVWINLHVPPATSQAPSLLFMHFVVYTGKDRGDVLLRIITIKRFIWQVCIQQSQLLSALKAVLKLWMADYLWAIVYIMEKSLTVIKMCKMTFLHAYCQKFFHNVKCILNMMKSFDRKESPFSFSVTGSYLSWYVP